MSIPHNIFNMAVSKLTNSLKVSNLIKNLIVWHFPIPIFSLSRKNISLSISYNSSILCFMHAFPIELEYTIYYLLLDPFCFVVTTLILYAEHEELCPITWWKFFLINRLCYFRLTKRRHNFCAICQIFTNTYHTWNPKFYSLFSSYYNFALINKCRSREMFRQLKIVKTKLSTQMSQIVLNALIRIRHESNSFHKIKVTATEKLRNKKLKKKLRSII